MATIWHSAHGCDADFTAGPATAKLLIPSKSLMRHRNRSGMTRNGPNGKHGMMGTKGATTPPRIKHGPCVAVAHHDPYK